MSRSTPTNEDKPKKKHWVGYDVKPIPLQRQSKYSKDMYTIPLPVAEAEDADYKYNRWDMEPVETENTK